MCLAAISWQVNPNFPLVISANRDEFFERPTQGLHRWESGFFGGKDLRSGGTWLGFHPNGRWALLTNFRDFNSRKVAKISRGKLVQDWLETNLEAENYLQEIQKNQEQYEGFNLLVSDGQSLWYLSNYSPKIQKLSPGIYGLSNGLLNESWPKTELAINQLKDIMKGEPDENSLLSSLKSTQTYDFENLPKTGVPIDMEIGLSAQLVRIGESYGTVSALAVVQEASGLVRMKERQFQFNYREYQDTSVSFPLNNT
ncbi:NRDE family protein [Algoriphagus marinus]|uniref:NRDE family protein n=1 Tax=Algoriphagus marinus TaxID=1925762 RepID=UPI00094B7DB8|nr:NRDE family protein [Algoriphagus marinus]